MASELAPRTRTGSSSFELSFSSERDVTSGQSPEMSVVTVMKKRYCVFFCRSRASVLSQLWRINRGVPCTDAGRYVPRRSGSSSSVSASSSVTEESTARSPAAASCLG